MLLLVVSMVGFVGCKEEAKDGDAGKKAGDAAKDAGKAAGDAAK